MLSASRSEARICAAGAGVITAITPRSAASANVPWPTLKCRRLLRKFRSSTARITAVVRQLRCHELVRDSVRPVGLVFGLVVGVAPVGWPGVQAFQPMEET